jgi:hypothetical protein
MSSGNSFISRIPLLLVGIGVILLGGMALWPSHSGDKFTVKHLLTYGALGEWTKTYGHAWFQVQAKVDGLRHAEEDNIKLRLENSHLRLSLEALQFDCHARTGSAFTHKYQMSLNKETGTKVGRTLASISYKPPERLLPAQLYTLGLTYLKAREDEKAAVLFSTLTGLEETDIYKTAKNLLTTGVIWYRLENYSLADHYFDEVLKKAEKPESIQFQAQARLWKSLVSKKLNQDVKVQYWLKELIDHHPQSIEATWVNLPSGVGHGQARQLH